MERPALNTMCFWIDRYIYTTGNACFAEGLKICRGPNLGHSLPRARHRSPRQRTAIDKEAFAEGTTLGKDRPSAKMSSAN